MTLTGIPASPGIAIGTAFLFYDETEAGTGNKTIGSIDPYAEINKLEEAMRTVERELTGFVEKSKNVGDAAQADILNSHIYILRDPEIVSEAKRFITEEKMRAEDAYTAAIRETAEIFAGMDDDPYLQERAKDIEDVGNRVTRKLTGVQTQDLSNLPPNTIVVARELKPSDTATLDRNHVIGFATDTGGATSHTAILAKAAGLVAVVGAGDMSPQIKNGEMLILDGTYGIIIVNPDSATLGSYKEKQTAHLDRTEYLKKLAQLPCVTSSGKRIILAANIGSEQEVEEAAKNGADAIGLFRTEFLYLDRDSAPDEEEQFLIYKFVLERMGNKPVIVRTLDIGGDKEIPYLGLPREENPFLGARALRLCFMYPEIFRTQIRALLRASVFGTLEIMFPMVQSVEEIEEAKKFLGDCKHELAAEGKGFAKEIRVGIMIEIPAAAIISDELARHCDFFSIGTNDLTQYTLAADRGNKAVAKLYNPFHPAVLKLIKTTIDSAHKHGIPCGMCGEFAGNPEAIPLLLEYGLDEFSMSAALIPATKDIIMNGECQKKEPGNSSV
jgi:phosphotransferase system enzyme I (PtsI)